MNSAFTSTLLTWYDLHARELPWRGIDDAYGIWLSEIILQQTRVQQGRDYWLRFMQRFPRVEVLAAASEDEVLRLWQGLGYYSRARNLHTAAKQIVEMGGFPQTLEGILSLKGVGEYTAAAVGSMAFGLPAAAVDGNVYRVLARHFGIQTPINSSTGKREFTELAQSLLPTDSPGTFNQAMMDFGSLQCTPQSPRCLICPLAETCVALHEGVVDTLPVKLRQTKVKERRMTYLYLRCRGHVAIHRRGEGDIWQGLWELMPFIPEGLEDVQLLRKDVKHVLTHRVLMADFFYAETQNRPSLPKDYRWVPETELDNYAKPRLIERLLESVPR